MSSAHGEKSKGKKVSTACQAATNCRVKFQRKRRLTSSVIRRMQQQSNVRRCSESYRPNELPTARCGRLGVVSTIISTAQQEIRPAAMTAETMCLYRVHSSCSRPPDVYDQIRQSLDGCSASAATFCSTGRHNRQTARVT
jgi:hypothetical protein